MIKRLFKIYRDRNLNDVRLCIAQSYEKQFSNLFLDSDIILYNGTWGISFTRAPTESRPDHVAILGGFFEDPASLWKLWKDNYVGFDSVFNQSRETWAWGAPDVLPFFNKGTYRSRKSEKLTYIWEMCKTNLNILWNLRTIFIYPQPMNILA